MSKVILVLIDGLGYQTCVEHCGYLEGLVHAGAATRWRLSTALPSMSRPLYETVHTGLTPHDHGVTTNKTVRPSKVESIFSVARAAGRRTGAAAYSWFSELYNGTPFTPARDMECNDESRPIQHGRFYTADTYPDVDLVHRAAALASQYAPDYLLVHPMGCDTIGHQYGGDSPQYRTQASRIDALLAGVIPDWMEAGYHICVTADHGMNADG